MAKREAAIRFLLDNKAVSSILITFQNFEEIAEYVNLSGTKLTTENISIINQLKENFGHLYCRHACGICEDSCPHKVPVNTIMRYNHYFMAQHREKYAMHQYNLLNGNKAEKCTGCNGYCEQACPFGVSIQALLQIANQNLV
jgi:predicted aldo/keto reductase-like oxidoreductase